MCWGLNKSNQSNSKKKIGLTQIKKRRPFDVIGPARNRMEHKATIKLEKNLSVVFLGETTLSDFC